MPVNSSQASTCPQQLPAQSSRTVGVSKKQRCENEEYTTLRLLHTNKNVKRIVNQSVLCYIKTTACKNLHVLKSGEIGSDLYFEVLVGKLD